MSVVKDYRFPVSVELVEGRRTLASARWKPDLPIATPPEFIGGVPGVWSPEDLLVAATAACYAVTLAAVAELREVPIRSLSVSGSGHVTRRNDGKFGFVAIELDVRLETDSDLIEAAEHAARRAEEQCIVTMALEVPVRIGVDIRAAVPEGALR